MLDSLILYETYKRVELCIFDNPVRVNFRKKHGRWLSRNDITILQFGLLKHEVQNCNSTHFRSLTWTDSSESDSTSSSESDSTSSSESDSTSSSESDSTSSSDFSICKSDSSSSSDFSICN
jgi:hypothetical protein